MYIREKLKPVRLWLNYRGARLRERADVVHNFFVVKIIKCPYYSNSIASVAWAMRKAMDVHELAADPQ